MKAWKKTMVATLLLSLTLTTGCASLTRTDYTRPDVAMPDTWENTTMQSLGATATQSDKWWESFNDATLNALIEEALTVNNDLAAAAVRVRRAQLQAGLTNTNLTPTVSVGANGSVSKNLDGGSSSKSFGSSLSLGYEIDLWGKLASQRDASQFEAAATELDLQAAKLSLVGTVAQLYWQIASLNERIANSAANLKTAEQTLSLTQTRKDAGAVSQLNVLQAEQSVTSLKASYESLLQQRTVARHALAILFNQAPTQAVNESLSLSRATPPYVNVGVPADILARRPDLAAAELRLKGSLANKDAQRLNFYPSFSLTGSLGTGSDALRDFLDNPIAALGARLALPFLQWNTTQLTLKVAEADYEEAVINFRKTLYTALLDVEDALNARATLDTQSLLQQSLYDSAVAAEKIAKTRYEAGQTGVEDWLNAQGAVRNAENNVIQNQYDRLVAQMTVFRALGGK
jgi:NodT family efflux transporter outer membrane factor (OMF) lipoprotein